MTNVRQRALRAFRNALRATGADPDAKATSRISSTTSSPPSRPATSRRISNREAEPSYTASSGPRIPPPPWPSIASDVQALPVGSSDAGRKRIREAELREEMSRPDSMERRPISTCSWRARIAPSPSSPNASSTFRTIPQTSLRPTRPFAIPAATALGSGRCCASWTILESIAGWTPRN